VATNCVEYGRLLFSFCTVPGEELRDIELVHNAMDENSLLILISGEMENSRHEEGLRGREAPRRGSGGALPRCCRIH
jgi:hypothetical protein